MKEEGGGEGHHEPCSPNFSPPVPFNPGSLPIFVDLRHFGLFQLQNVRQFCVFFPICPAFRHLGHPAELAPSFPAFLTLCPPPPPNPNILLLALFSKIKKI